MSLADALEVTVSALDPIELDTAAVELARIYARQLDSAAATAARAERVLREAKNRHSDDILIEEIDVLRRKLGEKECVDRIGARFHALLAELKATPKARGDVKPESRTGGTLHKLRAAK